MTKCTLLMQKWQPNFTVRDLLSILSYFGFRYDRRQKSACDYLWEFSINFADLSHISWVWTLSDSHGNTVEQSFKKSRIFEYWRRSKFEWSKNFSDNESKKQFFHDFLWIFWYSSVPNKIIFQNFSRLLWNYQILLKSLDIFKI